MLLKHGLNHETQCSLPHKHALVIRVTAPQMLEIETGEALPLWCL